MTTFPIFKANPEKEWLILRKKEQLHEYDPNDSQKAKKPLPSSLTKKDSLLFQKLNLAAICKDLILFFFHRTSTHSYLCENENHEQIGKLYMR